MYVGEFLLSVTAVLQVSDVHCLKSDKLLFVELHSANKILFLVTFLKSIHLRIDEDDNTSTSHRGCALRRDPVPLTCLCHAHGGRPPGSSKEH